jgi:hypothetical protein
MLRLMISFVAVGLLAISVPAAQTGTLGHDDEAESEGSQYAKELSSLDPLTRQHAAEELGRIVALDQKKLVEGYLLQEKDKRVRLALNWALYRMGKSELLFAIVRDLDSSRHDQAVNYLGQLERPEPLYVFLRHEDTRPKVLAGVIEALGQIGDGEALEQIRPFISSYEPRVSEAAKASTEKIQDRLSQAQHPTKTRPRTTTPKPD